MNGQNLTSHTGNETTVPIRPFSGNLGKGDIKVVAHSSNYSDSDEGIKTIRYNGPAPTDVYLNLLTQYGEDAYAMCENTVYHIYVHNTGPCNTTNYTWNVPSGWTVYYTYNNMISVNSNSSPGGMVEVFANTCCGTNSKILIDYLYGEYCGGYFMTMSPNPADYYVEITFEEESETMNKEDKIKVSKNKYGELGSYRVQIIDKEGNILKEIKSNKLKSTINIRDLRTGTYFLHLITEDEIYKQQLIIN